MHDPVDDLTEGILTWRHRRQAAAAPPRAGRLLRPTKQDTIGRTERKYCDISVFENRSPVLAKEEL